MNFRAVIEITGVNPYVLVTHEMAEQLRPGWRGPMPVLVQVNGQPSPPWAINMMPRGDGSYYLYLAGVVRKASKAKVGDTVDVSVKFNKAYRSGPDDLPDWFEIALQTDHVAMMSYQSLSPSRQKEVVRYLLSLKSNDARSRNLWRLLEVLGGQSGHYMGRDWKDGK